VIGRRELAAGLAVMCAFVIATVVIGSAWQDRTDRDQASMTYRQNLDRWRELQRGCQRSKTDRTAIAAALRAQATYLNQVLGAASVKADVKRAARVAQQTFNRSATDLESRTGTALDCTSVYPKPLPPAGVQPLL
jgi:hypothetical protein